MYDAVDPTENLTTIRPWTQASDELLLVMFSSSSNV